MELWIRSQDKRILQQVNNLYLDASYDNKRISAYIDDFATNLGEYKTKERALEVLDEIQKLDINNNSNVEVVWYFSTLIKITYNMPEE